MATRSAPPPGRPVRPLRRWALRRVVGGPVDALARIPTSAAAARKADPDPPYGVGLLSLLSVRHLWPYALSAG